MSTFLPYFLFIFSNLEKLEEKKYNYFGTPVENVFSLTVCTHAWICSEEFV